MGNFCGLVKPDLILRKIQLVELRIFIRLVFPQRMLCDITCCVDPVCVKPFGSEPQMIQRLKNDIFD